MKMIKTFEEFYSGLVYRCIKCNSVLVKSKEDICLSCEREEKLNEILKK